MNHTLYGSVQVSFRANASTGRILLNEFLRRQAAEGVQIVSAELIRANWLAQFGFVSHPRYAGLVRELESADAS